MIIILFFLLNWKNKIMDYLVNFKITRIDDKTGNLIYKLYGIGNTYSIKDTLKSLGFAWKNNEWSKEVTDLQIRECLNQVEEAGLELCWSLDQYLEHESYPWYEAQEKWKKNVVSKIEAVNEPVMPKFMSELFINKKWNKSFYGKKGSRYVFLNEKKVFVTDQQESEIEQYYKDLFSYNQTIQQITEQYIKSQR